MANKSTPRDVNSAYLAGVVDSDGSIGIYRKLNQSTSTGFHYRAILQISWKEDQAGLANNYLKSIKESYGGWLGVWVRKANSFDNKDISVVKYSIEGRLLKKLLEDLLPFLQLKKEQAVTALNLINSRKVWGRGNPKPESLWREEEVWYRKVNQLNDKNKKYT